jgi:hypothetical protein
LDEQDDPELARFSSFPIGMDSKGRLFQAPSKNKGE